MYQYDGFQAVEVDERFVNEWLVFGFQEMNVYLRCHADFEKWCRDHGKES